MKPELQAKLVETYPKIFAGITEPPIKSLMCFGFECGDGWYALIDVLCSLIQDWCDGQEKAGTPHQIVAFQVKEKWGGLRFYINSGDEYVYNVIDFAERMSYRTCENCGTTRDVSQTSKGWISSLCSGCKQELNRK